MVNIERQNIRTLDGLSAQPSLSVIDVSFISLMTVIPAVLRLLAPGGHGIALVKPQFEVGRGRVGKGGIVRDPRCTGGCQPFAGSGCGLGRDPQGSDRIAAARDQGQYGVFVVLAEGISACSPPGTCDAR